MAEVNRAERPLSPHVAIYRWPLNAVMSILHRATGTAMAASALLVVWWFLAAATSEHYFNIVNGLLTSWVGDLVMFASMAALWYHFTNGIRHLIWDTGAHFGKRRVTRSGITGLVATAALVIITVALS